MSHFALVSTSNPICSPSIQWPHDIKNMLATVGLHLEVLQRLCGPHGAKAADAALALIFRAGAMCNVAVAVASDSRSRRQPFEITAAVGHVVDLLAPAGPDGLRVNIVSAAPVHVLADQNDIFRVVFNVIYNAVTVARANPRLRRINISVERVGNNVTVRIADNGGGLPREVARRLFRPPAAGAIRGHGLAIARELMERNGGTLGCETSAEGTVFRLELAGLYVKGVVDGPVMSSLGRRAASAGPLAVIRL
jgi:signal transduction histidine kinase